jgi:hypothetical protein
MAPNSFTRYTIAGLTLVLISPVTADTDLMTLNNNPFTRPDILKKKPPRSIKAIPQATLPPEEIELKLTATMVSENAPLVIVNGEMLAVGEKIGEMELIAVLEGKAIFVQDGKKYSFMIDGLEQE